MRKGVRSKGTAVVESSKTLTAHKGMQRTEAVSIPNHNSREPFMFSNLFWRCVCVCNQHKLGRMVRASR